MNQMRVWEIVPRPKNEHVISTTWVNVNKRDEKHPKYQSRLVTRELKKRYPGGISGEAHNPSWEDSYATRPPISALQTLFAVATMRRVPGLDGRMRELPRNQCLVFLDIKKAHCWADARRRILVELPAQTGVDTQKFVGLLRKSLYGTRDAPANWEATILRVMSLLGFIQGKSNSCLYFYPGREIGVEVHGDDFTVLEPRTKCSGFPVSSENTGLWRRVVSWTTTYVWNPTKHRHLESIGFRD